MATTVGVTLPRLTIRVETAFTVTMLREYVTTPLSDAALQTYLDAALEAVDEEIGPAVVTERLHANGELLMLSREADSIVSIVEDVRWSALTLASDDYELSGTGMALYRLRTGTNPRWCWDGQVKVTYSRDVESAARISAVVALVKLDLTHAPGLASQQIGTWTESYAQGRTYEEERAAILASLSGPFAGAL